MTLLTPLALVGLLLLPGLVLLHLRRPRTRHLLVSSTMLWQGLGADTHRRSAVRLPLLVLLLQLLAVLLLVGSLARPASSQTVPAPRASHVYLVDDSLQMGATDVAPNRLAAARNYLRIHLRREPRNTLLTVIAVTSQPYVVASGTHLASLQRAVAHLRPGYTLPNFAAALEIARAYLPASRHAAALTILYALGDTAPSVQGRQMALSLVPIGHSTDDQAIEHFTSRCVSALTERCAAFARVWNEAGHSVRDGIVIREDGDLLARRSLTLPAHGQVALSFPVPGGDRALEIQLTRPDILPADSRAWSIIRSRPGIRTLIVGTRADTAGLAHVLSILPGVGVRVLSPAQYTAADAGANDLLVLVHWLPSGGLPAAPAVLLVDPPSLPGGVRSGTLARTSVSGEDMSSSLLSDVDLTSLDVPSGQAERLVLPPGLAPLVWSAGGPLMAAGDQGTQRVAIFSFRPSRSNIAQLSAFPVFMSNVVNWASAWAPAVTTAGQPTVIDPAPGTRTITALDTASGWQTRLPMVAGQPAPFTSPGPGMYRVSEVGSWGRRQIRLAANVEAGPGSASSAQIQPVAGTPETGRATIRSYELWWPWIGIAALLLLAAEWAYTVRRPEG